MTARKSDSEKTTQVNLKLVQDRKNSTKIIVDVEYTYTSKAKIDLDRLSKAVAGSIFRKLDKQTSSNINFGIQVSKAFNVVVAIDNKVILSTENISMRYTDNSKLKISRNVLKNKGESFAKVAFINDFKVLISEAKDANNEFKNCFTIK